MKQEIHVAAVFLSSFVQESERDTFSQVLEEELERKLQGHSWDINLPEIGQAFRAVKILQKPDTTLSKVSSRTGIPLENFPSELILWIDPNCVSYRTFNNYVHTLYDPNVYGDEINYTANYGNTNIYGNNNNYGFENQSLQSPRPASPLPSSPRMSPYTSPLMLSGEFQTATSSPVSIKRPTQVPNGHQKQSVSPPKGIKNGFQHREVVA